jgi:hypothetical protein
MSFEALKWCRAVQVTLVQKAILYVLADMSDEQGTAWPSISAISAASCASERAVQNAIRALTKTGLIRVDRTLRKTPTYFLQFRTFTPAGGAPRTSCTPQQVHPAGDAPYPRTSCTLPPQEMHPTPAAGAPKAPRKHQTSIREASSSRSVAVIVDLPKWIPEGAWAEWCSYRSKTAKGRWTQRAAELSMQNLEKLWSTGHDPKAVIEQSIANGWTGLFPDKSNRASQRSPGPPTKPAFRNGFASALFDDWQASETASPAPLHPSPTALIEGTADAED